MKSENPKIVRILTTPDELRIIANVLERLWSDARLGEDVPVHVMHTSNGELHFTIDQNDMHRQQRGKK